ncbi:HTH domain-containing protein [Lysinibacillus sp. ZYM-1]|uniref:HTH domain-containing protein n=1 Tax=Lysinibacillus sp. ZYM-1 TaxID=1681184 RepID=UPI0006CE8FD9|nr:HTH domain-containing protein [Lysinibacillus sp. ZYM-1]KPN97115.1 hypothetical protein AO843_14755 [Lysinibacillus sp. ZYM-1]
MSKYNDRAEAVFLTGHENEWKEHFALQLQQAMQHFNLQYHQLANMLEISQQDLVNTLNVDNNLPTKKIEDIEDRLVMLNFGFEGFDARERVKVIMNTLLTEFELTTEILSNILKIEESKLIDFQKGRTLDNDIDLQIGVNVMILNYVLHKS